MRAAGRARHRRRAPPTRAARRRTRTRARWSPSTVPLPGRPALGRRARRARSAPASSARSSTDGAVALEDARPRRRPATRSSSSSDRLALRAGRRGRLVDSLEQAFRHGRGRAAVVLPDARTAAASASPRRSSAPRCGITVREPSPNLFSFNSPLGACETCRGFGRVIDLDLDLVIPDPRKTLADGAIKPWSTKATAWERGELLKLLPRRGIPTDVPCRAARPTRSAGWSSTATARQYPGIRGWFRWLEGRTYKMHVRVFLSRYRSYRLCPACDGARAASPRRSTFAIDGRTIADVNRMSVARRGRASSPALHARRRRRPGRSPHLILERDPQPAALPARGRARLPDARPPVAHALGRRARARRPDDRGRLVAGQHALRPRRAVDRPASARQPSAWSASSSELRARENTVVVVEHDPEIIRAADHIIDLGPGAGERGGEMLFAGPYAALLARRAARSPADYLTGRRAHPAAGASAAGRIPGLALGVRGARAQQPAATSTSTSRSRASSASPASRARASRRWSRTSLYRGLRKRLGQPDGAPGACRRDRGRRTASPT